MIIGKSAVHKYVNGITAAVRHNSKGQLRFSKEKKLCLRWRLLTIAGRADDTIIYISIRQMALLA